MPAITTNWISGQKILFRWGIRDFELLGIVKKGLQPYSSDLGEPVLSPAMQEKKVFLQEAKGVLKDFESKLEVLRETLKKPPFPQPTPARNRVIDLANANLKGSQLKQEAKSLESKMEDLRKTLGLPPISQPIALIPEPTNLTSYKTFEWFELYFIIKTNYAKKLIEDIKEELSKESGDWADYTPRSQKEKKRIIQELLTHIYKEEEVNRLAGPANRKNISTARTLDSKSIRPPSTHKPIPTPEKQADDSIPVISFYKKDDYWQIGKEGNEANLTPLNGYELIQFLIRHKNEFFDPITLYNKGNVPEELKSLISSTSSQIKYNKKIFAKVKKENEALTEMLREGLDIEKKEEIEEKIKKGEKYLKEWNHRFPRFNRAKRNVRGLIKRAIEKLHEEAEKKSALSPLKKYLTIEPPEQTINIGFWSCYKPNPSNKVKWKLDPN